MQVLLAPWWWRAARTGLAAGAALLWVVVAEVGLLAEIDDATVAVLLTVLSAFGLTAYMTWRQTRWAREIAGPAGEHARPESGLARKLRLAGALLLAVALLTVFLQAAAGTASVDMDCQIYGPPDPHFAWVAEGHAVTNGCPDGPVKHAAEISWVRQADGNFVFWFPSLGGLVVMSPGMERLWLDYRQLLGNPLDIDRFDDGSRYVNFVNGFIIEAPDQSAVVRPGVHLPMLNYTSCRLPDRPCLDHVAQQRTGTIMLDWTYARADAYNVSYWVVGQPGVTAVEVARNHFVLDDPKPGATYAFQVQACQKRLLARSECTPNSNTVAIVTSG